MSIRVRDVPGVDALLFRRDDHEVDELEPVCQWMHRLDHTMGGVAGEQWPDEPDSFLRDGPRAERHSGQATGDHLQPIGPDLQPGMRYSAFFPEVEPVPALQAAGVDGEGLHDRNCTRRRGVRPACITN
jgi:hypothetical protein